MTTHSQEVKRLLHKSLLEVKKSSEKQVLNIGICDAVHDVLYGMRKYKYRVAFEQMLLELFKKWPEFSGDTYYPVPSCCEGLSSKQAYESLELWGSSPYGDARLRLLNFLIEETK